MIIYAVRPDNFAYGDKMSYRVEAYNLGEVIIDHFKYYDGLRSLIPFLVNSRLSERKARSLALDKSLKYERMRKNI